MALKLSLKASERVIAGGAVLRNATGKTIELMVENEVPLLREKEILSEAKADTPCKRVYFVIQLMYIDGNNLPKYQELYWDLARDIINAAPSTTGMFKTISEAIYNGKYYQALKETRKLMQYEEKAMSHAIRSGRSVQ
ncbi:MAG: flagellar biosynthesis repressor FlbT [Ignavibacteriae bacterium]|nr:flagellar biosynthesis repressor FlbT [Ignavibacteriota bacterium]